MGYSKLSDKWIRRIQRTTGLDVIWASGNGTYLMQFTTADHRHGWFNLKAYRGVEAGEVWGLYDHCQGFTSCWRLFATREER